MNTQLLNHRQLSEVGGDLSEDIFFIEHSQENLHGFRFLSEKLSEDEESPSQEGLSGSTKKYIRATLTSS